MSRTARKSKLPASPVSALPRRGRSARPAERRPRSRRENCPNWRVSAPLVPNDGSGVPSALNRATPNPLPGTSPARTIRPSGLTAMRRHAAVGERFRDPGEGHRRERDGRQPAEPERRVGRAVGPELRDGERAAPGLLGEAGDEDRPVRQAGRGRAGPGRAPISTVPPAPKVGSSSPAGAGGPPGRATVAYGGTTLCNSCHGVSEPNF